MATKAFAQHYLASKNCYAVIYNDSGQVFDYFDNTFKSVGSATTPAATMTEQASGGGAGQSAYSVTVNLSLLNSTLSTKSYGIEFYERLGGSPAPLTDTCWLYRTAFSVQAGMLGEDKLGVDAATVLNTTSGTVLYGILTITRNGLPVDIYTLDSSASCTVTPRESTAGSDLWTSSAATVYTNGDFRFSKTSPGYTDNRAYQHTVLITCAGEVTELRVPLPVFG